MMEQIGDILRRASLETNPPGPSPTYSREECPCPLCQQNPLSLWIRTEPDGTRAVVGGPKYCPRCTQQRQAEAEKERLAERRREAEAELPAVIEKQRERWLQTVNLPPKFLYAIFESFKSSLQPKAFAAVKSFCAAGSAQSSILLLSPNLFGVGKTHLLCALANEIIMTSEAARITEASFITTWPGSVYYTTETAMLARIRATFDKRNQEGAEGETEAQVYAFLHKIKILLVDDVGKVRPHDTSFLQSVYFNIIDGRYTSEKPIIMASNLSPAEFEAHVGGACADRLREMCGENIVVMSGKSYRLRPHGKVE